MSRHLAVITVLAALVSHHRPAMAQVNAAEAPASLPPAERRLSLADAVALASGSTAAVQIATLRTQAAEARVGQARGVLLPSVSGSGSDLSHTFNSRTLGIRLPSTPGGPSIPERVGPVEVFDARVRASQTVFDLSSWTRIGASRRGVDVSRADRGATAEAAAQAAALAYLHAARAQAVVDARRRDLAIADSLVRIAEAQVRAGIGAAIDGTRARTERASAEGALLVAQNQLDRAGIDLARAIGLDPGRRVALRDTLGPGLGGSNAPEQPAAAVALAIERRPELTAEAARQRQVRSDRLAIQLERLPRVDVAADYGLSGEHAGDAIDTRQVNVALTLPLLDGLRREARVQEQTALLRESEVRERDVREQIVADVNAALLDIGSGTEQQRVAVERLRLADEELSQAQERFQSGVAGNIEVINAQSALVRARDADIDARFATAVARVTLARATGVAQSMR